jgi:hypothetical protein
MVERRPQLVHEVAENDADLQRRLNGDLGHEAVEVRRRVEVSVDDEGALLEVGVLGSGKGVEVFAPTVQLCVASVEGVHGRTFWRPTAEPLAQVVVNAGGGTRSGGFLRDAAGKLAVGL